MGGHHQGRGRTAGLHAVGDIDDVGPVGALPHVVPVEHIVGVLVGVGQALGDEVAVHRVVVIAAVVGQEGVDVLRQRGVGHVGDRLTLHRHLGLYIAEGGGNGIRVCLVLPVDLAVIAIGHRIRKAVIDILPIGDQGCAGIAYEPGGDGDIVVVLGLKGPFLGNLIAVLVGVPLEIHMVGLGRLSHLGLTGRFQQSIISRIHLSIHIDLADHLQGVLGGPQLQGGGAVSVAHQIVVGEGGVIGPAADQGAHSRVHIGQLVFRTAPGPVLGLHDQQAGQRLVRDVKPAGLLQEFRAVHAGGKRHADPVLPLTGSLRDVDLDLPAVRPAGAVVYADLVGKVSIDPLIGADAGVRFLSVFNGGGAIGGISGDHWLQCPLLVQVVVHGVLIAVLAAAGGLATAVQGIGVAVAQLLVVLDLAVHNFQVGAVEGVVVEVPAVDTGGGVVALAPVGVNLRGIASEADILLDPVGPFKLGHDFAVGGDGLHVVGVLFAVEGPDLQTSGGHGSPVSFIIAAAEGSVVADVGVDGEVILILVQRAFSAIGIAVDGILRSGQCLDDLSGGVGAPGVALEDHGSGDVILLNEVLHHVDVILHEVIDLVVFAPLGGGTGAVVDIHHDSAVAGPGSGGGIIHYACSGVIATIWKLPVGDTLALDGEDNAVGGVIVLRDVVVAPDIVLLAAVGGTCGGAVNP